MELSQCSTYDLPSTILAGIFYTSQNDMQREQFLSPIADT